MPNLNRLPLVLAASSVVAFTLACTGGEAEPTCDLSLDTIAGREFVMSEAQPDGPNKDNPIARMKFVEEDGQLKVKYTAMSRRDIYTYDCEVQEKDGEKELKCAEKPRLQDWCEALLAHDKACTKKKLEKLGAEGVPEEELKKVIAAAKAAEKKAQENEQAYARWKAIRASIGNKLQGTLYVKVNEKRCRLSISDLYWTLNKGEKLEDSNPVGSNPFVESETAYSYAGCTNYGTLVDVTEDAMPEALPQTRPSHEIGKPIYYYFMGETAAEAEEGCSYSYDTHAGWLPKEQGVEAKVEDGKVVWRAEHTFQDSDVREVQGKRVGMMLIERYQDCGEGKKPIDTVCNTVVFE
jgi:hypothetical protein